LVEAVLVEAVWLGPWQLWHAFSLPYGWCIVFVFVCVLPLELDEVVDVGRF
jgi:hypothetical protein